MPPATMWPTRRSFSPGLSVRAESFLRASGGTANTPARSSTLTARVLMREFYDRCVGCLPRVQQSFRSSSHLTHRAHPALLRLRGVVLRDHVSGIGPRVDVRLSRFDDR